MRRVLGEQHDEQLSSDQGERRAGRRPVRPPASAPSIAVSCSEPGQLGQDEEPQEERRLGQAGEGHFAGGAHALEGRAGVQGGRGREEPAQAEQVGEQDRSPANEIGAGEPAERHEQAGERRRRPAPTTGPARNTQVVVVLKTEPFRKSLRRS